MLHDDSIRRYVLEDRQRKNTGNKKGAAAAVPDLYLIVLLCLPVYLIFLDVFQII